ncbi:MAG: polysaccharide pyruvyl transferase family protein [Bacteroidia bacterium]|nr:polysaccharide pyruvyl transferase family protein [Bacteroidia bacterium]
MCKKNMIELNKDIRIGILTWYNHGNYGSALQAYALKTFLHKQDYNVEIIPYVPQWERSLLHQPIKKRIKRLIKFLIAILLEFFDINIPKFSNRTYKFRRSYLQLNDYCTEYNISNYCKRYTTIISGSDQIWSPIVLDPIFLQNFITDKINKISYAVSLGGNKMSQEQSIIYKQYLSSFNSISVREEEGKRVLNTLGINSSVHIDPTLLLNASDYRSIAKSISDIRKPYIFCYFLRTDREYKKYVEEYAYNRCLQVIGISFNKEDYQWMKNVSYAGPREWLWLIDNAEVVFTNSYHGTIFSLIFHTPFFNCIRFTDDDPICQNFRLEQLDEYFDIKDYLIKKEVHIKMPYSFNKFDQRLLQLQDNAKAYLHLNIR